MSPLAHRWHVKHFSRETKQKVDSVWFRQSAGKVRSWTASLTRDADHARPASDPRPQSCRQASSKRLSTPATPQADGTNSPVTTLTRTHHSPGSATDKRLLSGRNCSHRGTLRHDQSPASRGDAFPDVRSGRVRRGNSAPGGVSVIKLDAPLRCSGADAGIPGRPRTARHARARQLRRGCRPAPLLLGHTRTSKGRTLTHRDLIASLCQNDAVKIRLSEGSRVLGPPPSPSTARRSRST